MICFTFKGFPANEQRLIYAGQQLENNRTMAYYKIQKASVVFMVMRLGGPPVLPRHNNGRHLR